MSKHELPTNDPALKSWIDSANDGATDFPIQNLPLAVVSRRGTDESPRVAVAIGDKALDLAECWSAGLFAGTPVEGANVFAEPTLNAFMARGLEAWSAVRQRASNLLRHDTPTLQEDSELCKRALIDQTGLEYHLPASVGDYTDFYASVEHATNIGSMFRPDNPLLPNYKNLPVGYHGRSSSLVISGTPVRRPHGQIRPSDDEPPIYAPCRLLDYELEMGCYVGPGNALGAPIPIEEAHRHIFGISLLNDWSARDVQKWEYQPLGPFNAKNFCSTMSPWIVSLDALAPFRLAGPPRAEGDPETLGYLSGAEDMSLDITLEVYLQSESMRNQGLEPHRISQGSFRHMFWTFAQMITHHTSTGCNLRPGDLLGSGTVSGKTKGERGCLLELTWRGQEPIDLPGGEQRKLLADGDEVIIRGFCDRDGAARIGFGECRGVVLPANG